MHSRYPVFAAILAMLALSSLVVASPKTIYGAGATGSDARVVSIGKLLASPDTFIDQKVRVKGRIADVCTRRGCWIDIADRRSGDVVRFKVKDGEIEFPVEATGKKVVAEGVLTKIEMTREQAVAYYGHLAEERNEPFDPSTVTGPMTRYQIRGTGAIVR